MTKLIIFGTGIMGDLTAQHFIHQSDWNVVAYTADADYVESDTHNGLPLVSFEDITTKYPPEEVRMFVGLGYGKANANRRSAYQRAKAAGYEFASFVSPHARSLKPIVHGENVFINESIFQPNTVIGNNIIIWSNNVIGHNAIIGDHCFISSGTVISGGVRVGESCFFGVNSSCRENIEIAEGSVIGAGTTVLRSTKPRQLLIAPEPTSLQLKQGQEDFLIRPSKQAD